MGLRIEMGESICSLQIRIKRLEAENKRLSIAAKRSVQDGGGGYWCDYCDADFGTLVEALEHEDDCPENYDAIREAELVAKDVRIAKLTAELASAYFEIDELIEQE